MVIVLGRISTWGFQAITLIKALCAIVHPIRPFTGIIRGKCGRLFRSTFRSFPRGRHSSERKYGKCYATSIEGSILTKKVGVDFPRSCINGCNMRLKKLGSSARIVLFIPYLRRHMLHCCICSVLLSCKRIKTTSEVSCRRDGCKADRFYSLKYGRGFSPL